MSQLHLKNLSKAFVDMHVFSSITATINYDQMILFTGPNGCGKSTLLSLLSGLIVPDSGELELNTGTKFLKHREIGEAASSFFGPEDGLLFRLTAEENISFFLKLRSSTTDISMNEIKERYHLNHILEKRAYQLTPGQTQFILLLRTLLIPGSIYLFDEPFVHIDQKYIETIRWLMERRLTSGAHIYFFNPCSIEIFKGQVTVVNIKDWK